MESKSSKTRKKDDPGWNHNHLKDPKKIYRVTCNFCGFTSSGGIYRAKQHQVGGSRDVKPCEQVPSELKEELEALYCKKQESNVGGSQNEPDFNIGDGADDVEVEQAKRNSRGSRGKRGSVAIPGSSKAKKTKSLMDPSLQKPGEVVDMSKNQGKLRQTSMNDSTDTARERTIQCIARFYYEARIPFEAAELDSFMDMLKAIGQYDLCLKPPSSYELRVSLNKKKTQLTKNPLRNHEEKGAKTTEDESTYDAAGSPGGPTAQSSPHNEEELNVRKKQNEPYVNIGDDADDVEVEQAKQNPRARRALVAIPGSSKAKKTKDLKDLCSQKPGDRTIQLKNHQGKLAKTNEDENTYDAAGSSGGPTAQSSPHNEELQFKDFMAYCGIPVIKELWKAVCRGINTGTSKGKTKEELEYSTQVKLLLSEDYKLLSKDWPDMTEVEEKWLDESYKKERIRKWQEQWKEFFEEEGIIEKFTQKFKVVYLEYKEEDKRRYGEAWQEIEEDDLLDVDALEDFREFQEDDLSDVDVLEQIFPEIPTGNFTRSSNV